MYQMVKDVDYGKDQSFSGYGDGKNHENESRSSLLKTLEKELHSSDKINKPPSFRLKEMESISVEVDST